MFDDIIEISIVALWAGVLFFSFKAFLNFIV